MDIAGIENWSNEVLQARMENANNFRLKCEGVIFGKDVPTAPRDCYNSYKWAGTVIYEIEKVLKGRGVMEKTEDDLFMEEFWRDIDED